MYWKHYKIESKPYWNSNMRTNSSTSSASMIGKGMHSYWLFKMVIFANIMWKMAYAYTSQYQNCIYSSSNWKNGEAFSPTTYIVHRNLKTRSGKNHTIEKTSKISPPDCKVRLLNFFTMSVDDVLLNWFSQRGQSSFLEPQGYQILQNWVPQVLRQPPAQSQPKSISWKDRWGKYLEIAMY